MRFVVRSTPELANIAPLIIATVIRSIPFTIQSFLSLKIGPACHIVGLVFYFFLSGFGDCRVFNICLGICRHWR